MVIYGAAIAGLSVVLGAFGAHALEKIVNDKYLKVFETAVKYQMYHSIAIIICGFLYFQNPLQQFKLAFKFFVMGISFFCGSLYLLVLFNLYEITSFRIVGILTPIGGVLFILGWVCIVLGARKFKDS